MKTHNDFILSSVTEVLRETIGACASIGKGIETYPLRDYIMQTSFLKMTGAQEQKMKCICWEIATHDYDYRRALLGNDDNLGECSTIKAKSKIYNILKNKTGALTDTEKLEVLSSTFSFIKSVFEDSNIAVWAQKDFNWFMQNYKAKIKINNFCVGTNLLENCLKYDLLYRHRNRCAHNLQSYQQNLPTLETLRNKDYVYENYFFRFTILILIDNIFIKLYQKYLNQLEREIFV